MCGNDYVKGNDQTRKKKDERLNWRIKFNYLGSNEIYLVDKDYSVMGTKINKQTKYINQAFAFKTAGQLP